MVKIVTYNVNGLRPRVAQYGSLRRLLDALDADIVCFQETKLSRQDLSADLVMCQGYEAFVSCNRSSKGRGAYSGVATFCRVTSAFSSEEVALPVAAEEGFTGLHDRAKNREVIGDFILEMPVEEEDLGEITKDELLKLDSEGRCMITDHGHFVLFNIYGPAVEEDDKERVRFKLLFYKIMQKRWEHLLALGRRVFVVGDLNIAPAAIDRCDAPPGFEKQMFREWLRSMLRDCGGPFFDAFRSKYPERAGAYTCFNQKVGAEEHNYGSRIDHILISGVCFHQCGCLVGHSIFDCHVEECEIMNQFKRGDSENMSKWKGGRSSKLEGSDHIPVYIVLNDVPELPVHNTPPSAARYLPEVRGWQQSIVSFLRKGKISEVQDASNLTLSKHSTDESCCEHVLESQDISKEEKTAGITGLSKGGNVCTLVSKRRNLDPCVNEDPSSRFHNSNASCLVPESTKASFSCNKTTAKKIKRDLSSQPTIKSFFQQPQLDTRNANTNSLVAIVDATHNMDESSNSQRVTEDTERTSLSISTGCTNSVVEEQDNSNLSCSLKMEKYNVASLEWQRIQQKMKTTLPLCKGHREPCIPRSVKKGSNIGRLFYVCARAQGATSNPEANCGHFQWASVKPKGKRS